MKSKVLTLAEHAEQVLREKIYSGELPAGARISPDEAAEQLGMSAMPVREALRSLASHGLVDAVARRGFRVRPADRNDFAETYDLRLMLDPHAARLAVPRMDEAALVQMDAAFVKLEQTMLAADMAAYDTDHRAFHFSVYDHCGSRWLLDIVGMLWANCQRYQRLSTGLRGTVRERIDEHRAIADACRAHDPEEAARQVHQHLDKTRVVVLAALDAEPGGAVPLRAVPDGKDVG